MKHKLKIKCSLCELEHISTSTVYFAANENQELAVLCNDKDMCKLLFLDSFKH